MKQVFYTVKSNEKIARDIYKMVLEGDTSALSAPGQFVNIKLDGLFLRRPISVYDYDEGKLTLIYKTVGVGTYKMAALPEGTVLDTLSGLGNGFDTSKSGSSPVLIGGGVGVPPMYNLARKLREQGKEVSVILGFNSQSDVFCEEEFKTLGCKVHVATADGSYGTRRFVTDVLGSLDNTFFYTSRPEPLIRAIEKIAKTSGQYSFEERMGCGFGACMGCSCKTLTGNKRICKEGPVMDREEIIWKD